MGPDAGQPLRWARDSTIYMRVHACELVYCDEYGAGERYIRCRSHRHRIGGKYCGSVSSVPPQLHCPDDPSALAKAGKTVLHLDPNEYYGGEQASLTLDELASWASARCASDDASSSRSSYRQAQARRCSATPSPVPTELVKDQRRYALSLFPAVLPSRGPLISTLIASDVSKYVSFKLLDSVAIWDLSTGDGGGLQRVPGSKEEVFKDKSIGLVDKRRLMKFLMWAGGDFEADDLLKGAFRSSVHAGCD